MKKKDSSPTINKRTKDMDSNQKMEYIVNRAAALNISKYDGILIENLSETAKSFLFASVLSILREFRQIPVYINYRYTNISFIQDLDFIVVGENDKKKNKRNYMTYSLSTGASYGEKPQIFLGFKDSELRQIAKDLYDYEEKGRK